MPPGKKKQPRVNACAIRHSIADRREMNSAAETKGVKRGSVPGTRLGSIHKAAAPWSIEGTVQRYL
jgi:hypothetical protein